MRRSNCLVAVLTAAVAHVGVSTAVLDNAAHAQARDGGSSAPNQYDERQYRSPYDPRPTPGERRELDRREQQRRAAERREAQREAEERRLSEKLWREEEERRRQRERRDAERRFDDEERRFADEERRAEERWREEQREARARRDEDRWAALGRGRDWRGDDDYYFDRRRRRCRSRRQIQKQLAAADLHVHTWIPRRRKIVVIAHNSRADRYDLVVDACRGNIIHIQRTKKAGSRRGLKRFWRELRRAF